MTIYDPEISSLETALQSQFQMLLNHGFQDKSLVWAISMNFVELLELRNGGPPVVVDDSHTFQIMETLFELDAEQRVHAQTCYHSIKRVRDALVANGHSYDSLLEHFIGAIDRLPPTMALAKKKMIFDLKKRANSSRLATN